MLLIIASIWAFFGILGTIQMKQNLVISVQHQKEVSKVMLSTYPGYNWIEAIVTVFFDSAMIVGGILGGVLWFLLEQRIAKQIVAERQRIEKIYQKMYGHGLVS